MEATMLSGGFVVTPEEVTKKNIILRGDKIEFVDGAADCDELIDITGKYVVPGFVDIHNHGYDLFDLAVGQYDAGSDTFNNDPEIYQNCLEKICKKYIDFGVTSFYLGTFAASIETLKHCYRQLAEYMSKPRQRGTAKLVGGLLEGSFINPAMAGAQNAEMVFAPAKEKFDEINDGNVIKLTLVGPYAGKKSCELTEYLTGKGVIVGFGHTDATCCQVDDAIKAGLQYCLHFTNGPTGGSYKPFDGGGAIEAVLKSDELYAELICDGYHVNPAYVLDIIKRKGVDKIIGVTDCSFVAGSDVREFRLGGIKGAVSEDGNYLQVVGKKNTLFGSNITMDRGFNNLLNWLTKDMQGIWNQKHPAVGFEEAVMSAAKVYSTNPCELVGLSSEGYGAIVNGAKADLCVLDIAGTGGDYKVTVEKTIVEGYIC